MYSDRKRGYKLDIPGNRKTIFKALSYVLVFIVGFLAHLQMAVVRKDMDISSSKLELIDTSLREYGNGWHSIEVFYGKTKHFEKKFPRRKWFAQANQDIIVSRLFRGKTNGYFLDLAANEAVRDSNTYSLEKKFQWKGLCMEPNPAYWFDLAHRDCQVVAAVVGAIRNDAVVFQKSYDGGHGGIVGDSFDNHDEKGGEVRYTVPLDEILNRFHAPKVIDYLSLDVEGAETFIMKHFPFDVYSFNVMTVERPKDELKALFEEFGYEYVATISSFGETLWVRKAFKDSLNIANVEEFFVQ